jgi:hypothetical protein
MTEKNLQAVSFPATLVVSVDLHCEILPISCTDLAVVAVAARKGFPAEWIHLQRTYEYVEQYYSHAPQLLQI